MKIFESTNSSKKIDGTTILKDVSFSIEQGERLAITGHNGSGKSSLLKLIGGIYEETSGKVIRAPLEIGYVPEHFPETVRFKLKEYLLRVGKISTKSEEELNGKIAQFAEHFAITDYLGTSLKNCSKGTKQKAGIIQALLKEPDLLLLDEPLTGLDNESKRELLNQLHTIQKGRTIIFTAHDSFLIEELSDRVIKVDGGKIISDSTNGQKEKIRLIKASISSIEVLTGVPCLSHQIIGESSVQITVPASESDKALALLLDRGCSIQELREKR